MTRFETNLPNAASAKNVMAVGHEIHVPEYLDVRPLRWSERNPTESNGVIFSRGTAAA